MGLCPMGRLSHIEQLKNDPTVATISIAHNEESTSRVLKHRLSHPEFFEKQQHIKDCQKNIFLSQQDESLVPQFQSTLTEIYRDTRLILT